MPTKKGKRVVLHQKVIMTGAHMPMICRCYNCGYDGLTRVEMYDGCCVYACCIACCFTGLCLCAPCVYCMDGLKDIHHYCANCNVIVAARRPCC